MNEVVVYSRRSAGFNESVGLGGGGIVDDILERLRGVEASVSELKSQMSAVLATIPHLATNAKLESVRAELRGEVQSVRIEVQSVRTDVQAVRTEMAGVKGEISALEARLIKWIIATSLTVAALVSTAVKFIH